MGFPVGTSATAHSGLIPTVRRSVIESIGDLANPATRGPLELWRDRSCCFKASWLVAAISLSASHWALRSRPTPKLT